MLTSCVILFKLEQVNTCVRVRVCVCVVYLKCLHTFFILSILFYYIVWFCRLLRFRRNQIQWRSQTLYFTAIKFSNPIFLFFPEM